MGPRAETARYADSLLRFVSDVLVRRHPDPARGELDGARAAGRAGHSSAESVVVERYVTVRVFLGKHMPIRCTMIRPNSLGRSTWSCRHNSARSRHERHKRREPARHARIKGCRTGYDRNGGFFIIDGHKMGAVHLQLTVTECGGPSCDHRRRQIDAQQLGEFICSNGPLKIVALSFRAVLALEGYKLRPCFHALRDDTCRWKLRPRLMTALTILASSAFVQRPCTNDLSIFSASIGNRRK